VTRIKEIRRARQITQKELAAKVGVSQPYIHDLELGNRSGKPGTLARIAAALGCTMDDLTRTERAD